MNVLITLPKELILKILSGEKTIEVRKTYPRMFNNHYDAVYVVQKGTRLVVMRFWVNRFVFANQSKLWEYFRAGKLGVDFAWLKGYAEHSDRFVCWEIEKPINIIDKELTLDKLNVKTAPQSLVYLHYDY